jgi:hypothetical protein
VGAVHRCPWRDLLEKLGNWNSIYQRFARWERTGVWNCVLEALSEGAYFQDILIDGG